MVKNLYLYRWNYANRAPNRARYNFLYGTNIKDVIREIRHIVIRSTRMGLQDVIVVRRVRPVGKRIYLIRPQHMTGWSKDKIKNYYGKHGNF